MADNTMRVIVDLESVIDKISYPSLKQTINLLKKD